MRFSMLLAAVLLAAPVTAQAPATPSPSPLAPLSFLVGAWQASGGGQPGAATGELSFQWAAGGHAILRNNESATASGRHLDVMLIYATADGAVHATYVDNEGHTIEYRVTTQTDPPRAVFESAGPGPRFRLWYQEAPDHSLATGFAIAAPGSSEFKTYLKGVARPR